MNRNIKDTLAITLALVVLALWIGLATVLADDVGDVLARIRSNARSQPTHAIETVRLTVIQPDGFRMIREMRIFAKNCASDSTKLLVYFLAPPDLRDVAFLSREDRASVSQWLYFPETQRLRRLPANVTDDNIASTDFSYADTRLFFQMARDWTKLGAAKVVKGATGGVDGIAPDDICIAIVPPDSGPISVYGLVKAWFGATGGSLRRVEMYDRTNGALSKVFIQSEFSQIRGVPFARHLELKNVLMGSETIAEIVETDFKNEIPDELFELKSIQRGTPLLK